MAVAELVLSTEARLALVPLGLVRLVKEVGLDGRICWVSVGWVERRVRLERSEAGDAGKRGRRVEKRAICLGELG